MRLIGVITVTLEGKDGTSEFPQSSEYLQLARECVCRSISRLGNYLGNNDAKRSAVDAASCQR